VLQSPVVGFARGTPGCTITVTFSWFDPDGGHWTIRRARGLIRQGLLIQAFLRKTGLVEKEPDWTRVIAESSSVYRFYAERKVVCPPNLHFVPLGNPEDPLVPEECRAQFRLWFKEGF
jgi:hypothetical protein